MIANKAIRHLNKSHTFITFVKLTLKILFYWIFICIIAKLDIYLHYNSSLMIGIGLQIFKLK